MFLKSLVLFVVAVSLASGLEARFRRDEKYDTKYDNVDWEKILHSDRLLKNYVNCLMDRGRCTPDGSELKRNIPDALENNCSKCNEHHRSTSNKVVRFLYKEKPEIFKELEEKYDPRGNYREKYQAELNAKSD